MTCTILHIEYAFCRRILLDPSDENVPEYIGHLKKVISDERILINDIIVSHWHHDHIGGVDEVLDVIENKGRRSTIR